MKFELNLVADKPTVNGRIYTEKQLKEAFSKTDIPVTVFPTTDGTVDIAKIIGFANLLEFKSDKIEFEVRPINEAMLKVNKGKKLTVSGIGEIYNENYIKAFSLIGLFVVQ